MYAAFSGSVPFDNVQKRIWMGSFDPLPLSSDAETSSGNGLHAISASPVDSPSGARFVIPVLPGHDRSTKLAVFTEPEHDHVDHDFFLARSEKTKTIAFFNDYLYITRRFADRLITIGRENMVTVDANDRATRIPIASDERRRALIEDLGLSEAVIAALPPDMTSVPAIL